MKHKTCRSPVDIYDNSTDRKNGNSIYYNFKKENDHKSSKHNTVVAVESCYPVIFKIMQHFLCKKKQ